jgi:glycosyltransferase involved in cell wall biosynthesis
MTAPSLVLNGRFLHQELTGVQRYAHELLTRMPELDVIAPHAPLGPAQGHLWEQLILPRLCSGRLLWSPGNTGPLTYENQVVTLHDASTLDHPEWFSGPFAKWYRFLLPRLARRVKKIITVSEFSRRELARLCDVPPEKIVAIPNGISPRFAPASAEQKAALTKKHALEKPFVLYLGSLEPRKNVAALLAAWKNIAPRGHELVLAGAASRIFRERGFADLPPATRLLGRVGDDELPALLSAADWFAFPALYEGFGFPPLEAMACGTPVLCSNAASLPEVCGASFDGKTGAALYFDPHHVDDLAAQLSQALQLDGEARARLVAQGRAQAARFTWDRCAEQTRAVLLKAAA